MLKPTAADAGGVTLTAAPPAMTSAESRARLRVCTRHLQRDCRNTGLVSSIVACSWMGRLYPSFIHTAAGQRFSTRYNVKMATASDLPLTEPRADTAPLRFVTAASLFDGHDAAINIMRRIIQAQGAEVIQIGRAHV